MRTIYTKRSVVNNQQVGLPAHTVIVDGVARARATHKAGQYLVSCMGYMRSEDVSCFQGEFVE